jgi:hypothetical protein
VDGSTGDGQIVSFHTAFWAGATLTWLLAARGTFLRIRAA